MKTISILLFSVLLNGCNASKDAKTSLNQDMSQKTLNGNFVVTKLDSQANIEQELSLTFDDKTKAVSGFSGCNRFFGNYTVDGDNISFKSLASTEKYCEENTNKMERDFLKTLKNTTNYKLEDNKIVLLKDKKEILSANQVKDSKIAQNQEDTMIFEYSAVTRGTFKMVKIDQNNIKSQLSRNAAEATTNCSKENWDTLKSLTESIDIKSLSKLEPPSKAHQYDGAAIASLTIKVNGETYQTPAFDDGNPPKEIANLVNNILDMAAPKTKKED